MFLYPGINWGQQSHSGHEFDLEVGGGSYIFQVTNYRMSVCCSQIYTRSVCTPPPLCVCVHCLLMHQGTLFSNSVGVLDWKWKECKSLHLHVKIFLPPPPISVHKWGKTEGIAWKDIITIRLIFQISVWDIPGLTFFKLQKQSVNQFKARIC